MSARRKIVRALVAIALLVILAVLLLPWKQWVANTLIAAMQEQGLGHVTLNVSSIGLNGATLTNVSVGESTPLKLDHLDIAYRLNEVLHGQLRTITLKGLAFEARQTDAGWTILGLESLFGKPASTTPFTIPVTREALAIIPFDQAGLDDSTLHVVGKSFSAEIPLTLEWLKTHEPMIAYSGHALSGKMGEMIVTTGDVSYQLKLDIAKAQWDGPWKIDTLSLTGAAIALPPMACSGNSTAQAQRFQLSGRCSSADKAFLVDFALDESLDKPQQSVLTITSASMPWSGGTLGVKAVRLPLGAKKAITINLTVSKVAIDLLMQSLTGDRVKATGVVSGIVPVTIGTKGDITFQNASLKAEQPGTIMLSPETIPGDNAQVALVRDVLKNLHYNLLSLDIDNGDDGKLGVTLAVEGANPEVQNGRAIKLKVHLSGDVLDLVQQNLMLMTDPKKFIQQDHHEKN